MFLYKIYILQLTYAIFLNNNNNIDRNSFKIELKKNGPNDSPGTKILKYTIKEITHSDSFFWRGIQFLKSGAIGVNVKVRQTKSALNADFDEYILQIYSVDAQQNYECAVEPISEQISSSVDECIKIFTDNGSTQLNWVNFKLYGTCNVLQLLNDIQFNLCTQI